MDDDDPCNHIITPTNELPSKQENAIRVAWFRGFGGILFMG